MTSTPPDFATGARLSLFNAASAAMGAEALLRRTLLAASRDFSQIQDQIDCAELALAMGEGDTARLLYELVFLRLGFSAEQLDRQRELARRTGLWREEDIPAAEPAPPPSFSVDAALSELEALQTIELPALPERAADLLEMPRFGHEARPVPPHVKEETAQACSELCALLRRPEPTNELVQLLGRLRDAIEDDPPSLVERLGGDIDRLTRAFAFANLRDFLLEHQDLAFAPMGSPALFHTTARLRPGALGAWLSNAGNIVRNGRDVLAMIQLATGSGEPPVERWSVLLAVRLPQQLQLDLIDELADSGLLRPIWALLASVSRRLSDRDRPILWRVRDAGLDCGDGRLAIAAQRMVAELALNDRVEWSILGEIYGTIGDDEGAEAMFARCLQIDPEDEGTLDRLAALRQGRFGKYAVIGGFGTPKSRQRLRRARWEGAAEPVADAA